MDLKNINPIKKILIANRGEIAIRVINTAREMGISTVAVFSDADNNALFVEEADEAIALGGNQATESYLNQEKIIAAAKQTNADAIHPGYGFLSENADFAKRCETENIRFIGPSSSAITAMGSKAEAKAIMAKNSVPVIPGYEGTDQTEEKLIEEALKIGFPVLLKASAGGGGKGMRVVNTENELSDAIKAAKRESLAGFGDDRLIIEKYFVSARHVEFQIFGDTHGNAIHLFERECSIQRRHQKVLEESPSPALSTSLREQMGEAAINAAKAINYTNAGTVEFIVTGPEEFYFLEVNTRLQVEHPVTEMITGLDLVKLQINVTEGYPIPFQQHEIKQEGYAVECRLYAEDPNNNFLPVTGTVQKWEPKNISNVRYDSAIRSGSKIDVFYDPMIAKVIAYDSNRMEALRKLNYALKHTACLGLTTNKEFLIDLTKNQDIISGNYDTHFIDNHFEKENQELSTKNLQIALAAATIYDWQTNQQNKTTLKTIPSGWRNNFYQAQQKNISYNNNDHTISYNVLANNEFSIGFGNMDNSITVKLLSIVEDKITFSFDNHKQTLFIVKSGNTYYLQSPDCGQIVLKEISRFPESKADEIAGGYQSPMPGEIIKVLVKAGDTIKKGQGLIILSSMKMENTIEAHEDGKIEEIFVEEKAFVEADELLLKMEN